MHYIFACSLVTATTTTLPEEASLAHKKSLSPTMKTELKVQKEQGKSGSIGIRFCEVCNNMMYLEQDVETNQQIYACQYCDYKRISFVILICVVTILLLGACTFVALFVFKLVF